MLALAHTHTHTHTHTLAFCHAALAGVLYMNECGSVGGVARLLVPHPEFRLILALDPRHGEVSRAMRNRGIELCLLPPMPPAVAAPAAATKKAAPENSAAAAAAAVGACAPGLAQQAQQGALRLLAAEGMGAGGPRLLATMARTHAAVCALAAGAHRRPPGLGALGGWARLARILAQRGWAGGEALQEAWHLVSEGCGCSGHATQCVT